MIVQITGTISDDYPLSQLRDMLITMSAELVDLERRYETGAIPMPVRRRYRDGENCVRIELDDQGEA